jgi:hypothetical protein
MSTFTLDTSGVVDHWRENRLGVKVGPTYWSDLTPFEQGYIQAAFASAAIMRANERNPAEPLRPAYRDARFSDLAPETLAAILKDCEAVEKRVADRLLVNLSGAQFWEQRQRRFAGICAEDRGWGVAFFTAAALSLGDDGKIHQQAAA